MGGHSSFGMRHLSDFRESLILSQPQLSPSKIREFVALTLPSCCENKEIMNINVKGEHSTSTGIYAQQMMVFVAIFQ